MPAATPNINWLAQKTAAGGWLKTGRAWIASGEMLVGSGVPVGGAE
jgi:hypothetical protein